MRSLPRFSQRRIAAHPHITGEIKRYFRDKRWGVSGHDLRNARLAEVAFQPSSLDAPTSGQPGAAMPADLLGGEDPRMEHVLDMQAVATHWRELPLLEQKILFLRFYGSLTQDQIALDDAIAR